MADIDIERKNSHGLLWAILGIAALGLLLFWLLRGSGADRVTMVGNEPATETATPSTVPIQPAPPTTSAAVQQYQQACGQPQTGSPMPEAQYTSNCIDLLALALEATAASQLTSLQPRIDSARAAATQLATEQDSIAQSELTREAFDSLVGAIESIHGTTSTAAVDALEQTAEAVDPKQPLSAQTAQVHRFFSEAGSLLGATPSTVGV